ncbi:caspase family protein [Pseudenhygromyxa sp. WMMC2535]|uniref:caspase family protein n=1 Tax=Pseudenhygromyxa sp. WMMC2535 TaxID=2712867 RepID=UPI0015521D6A|nr:caspase family protein [Pseudenhygromyxa sp. WMMC2535]NVB40228.1 caspase family protein [Pseudenhygromyxa sp. WMMC2535]
MKRALIIGGSRHQRKGIKADLDLVQALLVELGFSPEEGITRRSGGTTRELILHELRAFAGRVETNDVALVYYTGHAGIARFDGEIGGERQPLREWRYLVPDTGPHSARRGHFAGVLDVELGEILGALGERCPNLTVIFECCYAGGLLALPAKNAGRSPAEVHTFFVPEALRGEQRWSGRLTGALEPGPRRGGPIVVAAASECRRSHELDEGRNNGVFTWALVEAIRETRGAAICWGSLFALVRAKVRRKLAPLNLRQRPVLIGPRGRRVFGTELHDTSREFEALVGTRGRVRLMAGALHGLACGDELELLSLRTGERAARARIEAVEAARADLATDVLVDCEPWTILRAVLSRRARPTPVRITGEGAFATELRAAVRASVWLREWRCEGGGEELLELCARDGQPGLRGPDKVGLALPERVAGQLAQLEALARARSFERACAALPRPPETMDFWLRASAAGEAGSRTFPLAAAHLDAGMRCLEYYTGGIHAVSIVNVGADGLARLLHTASGTTQDLRPEEPGETAGTERGVFSTWPAPAPHRPGSETFYFVVSTEDLGLEVFASEPTAGLEREPAAVDVALERMFEPVAVWAMPMTVRAEPSG